MNHHVVATAAWAFSALQIVLGIDGYVRMHFRNTDGVLYRKALPFVLSVICAIECLIIGLMWWSGRTRGNLIVLVLYFFTWRWWVREYWRLRKTWLATVAFRHGPGGSRYGGR
jgi:hypothetical protein